MSHNRFHLQNGGIALDTTFGAVILCGGSSRRMGRDKAELTVGGETFLQRLIRELGGYPEVLLSAADSESYARWGVPVIPDRFPHAGPAAGLQSALTSCRSDALVCVPCDLPLFSKELGDALCAALRPEDHAAVVETRDGRIHPLCGVYRREAAPILERCLTQGTRRMRDILGQMRVRTFALADTPYGDELVTNLNTPEEYRQFCRLTGDIAFADELPEEEMRTCLSR